MKNRASILDLAAIGGMFLVALFIALEIDIFITEDEVDAAQQRLELNEVMLLGTLLSVGLLVFAMRRYRAQKREIARRIAAEGKARELAYQDPLTGLANRRQFEEALREAIASTPEAGYCHAVLMMDLNGFKQVNDSHGHGIGDEVLIVAAQRLLGAVRDGDLVARLGGDEFVVLCRHLLGAEAATSMALRLLQAFSTPIATGRMQHMIGSGLGIALIPQDATTAAEALRRADVALYRAKAERRSAFRFFEEAMDRHLRERQEMEERLKRALSGDGFSVRFRPSFDLGSGAVVGFEAIPFWVLEGVGEVPAERFLPIAEETGLVHALGDQVLEKACRAAATWPGEISLAMDVLPGQIRNPALGKRILEIVGRCGIDPRRIQIEVAEHLIVLDLDAARTALGPLRDAGVAIALDNFGTGYSNLYHIREFQIDKVKIARRLVENMAEDEAGRLVRALAGLGRGLGVAVSADGLGGSAGESMLLGTGIREAQDAGQPLDAADAAMLVAARRGAGREVRRA